MCNNHSHRIRCANVAVSRWISKLKLWSINYYTDTVQAAEHAARDPGAGGRRA
jgi:hypothetical protein